ncbi:MAG: hypothetical protein LAT81_16360 [Oceanicaulis sp.]|nr:hypothetical protein [Oceanicaulis sp.]
MSNTNSPHNSTGRSSLTSQQDPSIEQENESNGEEPTPNFSRLFSEINFSSVGKTNTIDPASGNQVSRKDFAQWCKNIKASFNTNVSRNTDFLLCSTAEWEASNPMKNVEKAKKQKIAVVSASILQYCVQHDEKLSTLDLSKEDVKPYVFQVDARVKKRKGRGGVAPEEVKEENLFQEVTVDGCTITFSLNDIHSLLYLMRQKGASGGWGQLLHASHNYHHRLPNDTKQQHLSKLWTKLRTQSHWIWSKKVLFSPYTGDDENEEAKLTYEKEKTKIDTLMKDSRMYIGLIIEGECIWNSESENPDNPIDQHQVIQEAKQRQKAMRKKNSFKLHDFQKMFTGYMSRSDSLQQVSENFMQEMSRGMSWETYSQTMLQRQKWEYYELKKKVLQKELMLNDDDMQTLHQRSEELFPIHALFHDSDSDEEGETELDEDQTT